MAVNYAYKLETTVVWYDVNTEMLNNNINENNAETETGKEPLKERGIGDEQDKQLQEAKASRKLNRIEQNTRKADGDNTNIYTWYTERK